MTYIVLVEMLNPALSYPSEVVKYCCSQGTVAVRDVTEWAKICFCQICILQIKSVWIQICCPIRVSWCNHLC